MGLVLSSYDHESCLVIVYEGVRSGLRARGSHASWRLGPTAETDRPAGEVQDLEHVVKTTITFMINRTAASMSCSSFQERAHDRHKEVDSAMRAEGLDT